LNPAFNQTKGQCPLVLTAGTHMIK